MNEELKKCCQESFSNGYKEGFNVGIKPQVKMAELSSTPTILYHPHPSHDIEDVLKRFREKFPRRTGKPVDPLGVEKTDRICYSPDEIEQWLRENLPGDNETTRSALFPDNVVCPRCCKNIDEEKESTWECPVCSVLQHRKCRGDICDLPGDKDPIVCEKDSIGGRRRDWTDEEKRKGLDKFRNGQLPGEEGLDVDKLRESTIHLIDEYFPKGKCAERGQALVLYALILDIIASTFSAKPPVGEGLIKAAKEVTLCHPRSLHLETKIDLLSVELESLSTVRFAPKRSIKWPEEKKVFEIDRPNEHFNRGFNKAIALCKKASAEGEKL